VSGNNNYGVAIDGASGGAGSNVVAGNTIGLGADGSTALGNSFDGVRLMNGTTNNTVGGTTAGAGNVISKNGVNGVQVSSSGTTGNVIAGNYIGTDASGLLDRG